MVARPNAIQTELQQRPQDPHHPQRPRSLCPDSRIRLRSGNHDLKERHDARTRRRPGCAQEVAHLPKKLQRGVVVKFTKVSLSEAVLENFQGRFFLLVDQSGDGCWPWLGPRHSSGAGRYLWRTEDGGNDRYVLAHRVAYFLSTGELPKYMRNLCGNLSCCKASHWWAKPTGRWKPKPRKAKRGSVRRLPASDIEHIRLLDSLGSDEDEIGQRFGLTKRQVADVAMGKVRPEAGGRIRGSRDRGIRSYHEDFERELLAIRPERPMRPQPEIVPQLEAAPTPSVRSTGCPVPTGRPFPEVSYGHT